MKGIVFTEFIEMVEDKFSFDIADQIIEDADLESGGVYTAVGNYDHGEMLQLVGNLSEQTNVCPAMLVHTYGEHLFGQLAKLYPNFFETVDNALEFLASVDQYIHVEVRKLYPDAELPDFQYEDITEDSMVMLYKSSRPFADLAEGMIKSCIEHFKEKISVEREDMPGPAGTHAKFTLVRQSA